MIRITIDDSAIESEKRSVMDRLRVGLRGDALDAARQGIEEARRNHPYTDRTGVLSGYDEAEDGNATSAVQVTDMPDGEEAADMIWPAGYASFVDKGTSGSRPYPYTPQAIAVATRALKENVEKTVAALDR